MSGLGDWAILIYLGISVFSNVYGGSLTTALALTAQMGRYRHDE